MVAVVRLVTTLEPTQAAVLAKLHGKGQVTRPVQIAARATDEAKAI